MRFEHIPAGVALTLLLAACGGEQDPAPVEYRSTPPAAAAAPASAAPAPAPQTGQPDSRGVIVYPDYAVVQARSGDTVEAMAQRAGVAPSELSAYNGLPASYTPRPGDELVLPPRPGGYQLAAAEPLSGPISEPAPGAATTAPGEWNPAAIGNVLGDETPETATAGAAPSSFSGFETGPAPQRGVDVAGRTVVSHEVAPGETIYTISRLYDVRVETLIEWNNLVGPSYTVYPGQVLSVPAGPAATAPTTTVAESAGPSTELGAAMSPEDKSLTQLPPPRSAIPEQPVEVRPLESPQLGQYQTPPAAETETAAAAPAPAPEPAPAAAPAGGRLLAPVDGEIVRGYSRAPGAARNDGVDFAATEGEPVRAADDGTVALVSRSLGGLGNIILIRHNTEILTVYGRVGEIKVAKGARVTRGQEIATVAPARGFDGATVHFEVRRGAVSVDPEEYL